MANSIFARCDDSGGRVGDLFHFALTRLGPIAEAADAAPDTLADPTYDALIANDYGQYRGVIEILAPAFGDRGLAHLKERMIALSDTLVQRSPEAARRVVFERAAEMDGNVYYILTPAAEALASRSPLAATLLLRAMIDFTLENARSKRYKHAARHIEECARLAASIGDYAGFETHAEYDARISDKHCRKTSFYRLIG